MNAQHGISDGFKGVGARADGSNAGVLDRDGPEAGRTGGGGGEATDRGEARQAKDVGEARHAKDAGEARQAKDEGAPRPAARLGMLVGNERLLVDLAEAGEILPMPPSIVPVPLTRDWFLGVTNVRGSLHTVVDLRRFSGRGTTEVGKESRLLSLSPSLGFNVTLIVSRMLGLRNTSSMTPLDECSTAAATTRAETAAAAPWIGNAFTDADGEIWREFSPSKLIATPEFLVVGR